MLPDMSFCLILHIRPLCPTLSNASDISKKVVQTSRSSSKGLRNFIGDRKKVFNITIIWFKTWLVIWYQVVFCKKTQSFYQVVTSQEFSQ